MSAVRITVLYFAGLREKAGRAEAVEEVAPGTTAGALWEALRARPALAGTGAAVGLAVNGRWSGPDRVLADGDTLALLPPVSGG
jgi:molybdopterin converting factor subunit 1